ncbi:MAG: hypothetical protein NUV75_02145 [Gallionella sp.]|nr:hypothetical protein [Gallionella sp.]
MIEALLAISVAAGVWSMQQPYVGTYTLTKDGQTIVRMDTRTGTMERCTLAGNALSCRAVVAAAQDTQASAQ